MRNIKAKKAKLFVGNQKSTKACLVNAPLPGHNSSYKTKSKQDEIGKIFEYIFWNKQGTSGEFEENFWVEFSGVFPVVYF